MHLAEGSDLIDGGQDVGLVYAGAAPDLGAFEFSPTASAVYTFTGNGNWSNSANWLNASIPPASLNAGNQIIINPVDGGQCLLDIPYTVSPGAILTIMPGKQMLVPGSLNISN
jgi:hypothetical protein